jgi:hypothetical protein
MKHNQKQTIQRVERYDLFNMDSVAMDSPRLAAIKAADIKTHHAPHMIEDPWLAIPMNREREILDSYDLTPSEKTSIPDMMAGYCRLLDECGMVFYGQTEREAQDAALAFLSSTRDTTPPKQPKQPI